MKLRNVGVVQTAMTKMQTRIDFLEARGAEANSALVQAAKFHECQLVKKTELELVIKELCEIANSMLDDHPNDDQIAFMRDRVTAIHDQYVALP